MEGVNAHIISLHIESKMAHVNGFEFVMVLQVRPAPEPTIDHMRKAFAVRHLEGGGRERGEKRERGGEGEKERKRGGKEEEGREEL